MPMLWLKDRKKDAGSFQSSILRTDLIPSLAPVVMATGSPTMGRETNTERQSETKNGSGLSFLHKRWSILPETFSKPLLLSPWQNQVMPVSESVSSRINGIPFKDDPVSLMEVLEGAVGRDRWTVGRPSLRPLLQYK